MSDTLYMQTDMNILVKHPHVYLTLQDFPVPTPKLSTASGYFPSQT